MKIHKSLGARFAVNLAREREARGVSHEKFAEILQVSKVYEMYLEKGERTPSLEMIEVIAKKLRKDPLEMLR